MNWERDHVSKHNCIHASPSAARGRAVFAGLRMCVELVRRQGARCRELGCLLCSMRHRCVMRL